MKFKKGDKVKRIIDNFYQATVGCIYTVDEYNSRGCSITLEGLSGSYDTIKFELVEQEEQEEQFINFLP